MWLPQRVSERDPEREERTTRVVARLARAWSIRYVVADTLTAQGPHD